MINCEAAEEAMSDASTPLPEEIRQHVSTCPACGETAQLLQRAMLPQLTSLERASLDQLPRAAYAAWQRQEAQSQVSGIRRLAGYALAAGLGALITASAQLSIRDQRTPPAVVQTVALTDSFDWADADESVESGDDLDVDENDFFEVSWPALAEGESP